MLDKDRGHTFLFGCIPDKNRRVSAGPAQLFVWYMYMGCRMKVRKSHFLDVTCM